MALKPTVVTLVAIFNTHLPRFNSINVTVKELLKSVHTYQSFILTTLSARLKDQRGSYAFSL